MADRIGQQLGNYRLLRLLGQGGFADVYLGKHIYLNTFAAIKVLQVRLHSDDQESFLNEARIVADLVHAHIIRVLDFGIEDALPFLVMDYAPHGNLRQRHPKNTILPMTTIVSYVKQITNALQYAHNKKLIHRDIKPENFLLGPNDEILLSDFGIALVAQTVQNQNIQQTAGTVAYMAPEQIRGLPRLASDQYSLGIIVYEWLCGTCPFQGTYIELYQQHLHVPPPSLREKIPTISADVERVIFTALAKDPQQRFASVRAFANAFEQACFKEGPTMVTNPISPIPPTHKFSQNVGDQPFASNPVSLQPSSPSPPTPVPEGPPAPSSASPELPEQKEAQTTAPSNTATLIPKKRPVSRRAILIGLGGLTIAGAAGGTAFFWPKIAQKVPALFSPALTATSTPLQNVTLLIYQGHSRPVNSVAWSPSGTQIVSGSGDNTVQVWNDTTGALAFKYSHALPVKAVAWSHDGQHIASAGLDKVVRIWSTEGHIVLIYHGHKGPVNAVAWSPDGKSIASGGADHNTVHVWNASTGASIHIYSGHSSQVTALTWSPDGARIASASLDATVQVWDERTGAHALTYKGHADGVDALAWSPDGKRIASGGADDTVQVWDAVTGTQINTYALHTNGVTSVAWSPDGKRIVSASYDSTARVWDSDNGDHPFIYKGHSKGVRTVAWSPDGKLIASGGGDKTVHVWEAI